MSYIMYKGKQYCSNPTENTEQYITDAYDSTKTYAVGDYRIYNNTLLVCNTAITEPEEFDETKWDATNIGEEINEVKSNMSHVGMVIHSTTLDTEEKVKSIYGGTSWVKIEGRFLLGQSSSHAVNTTGGEETHKLTVAEMPSHNHAGKISARGAYLAFCNDCTGGSTGTASYNSTGDTFTLTSNGGDQAHNNMPPYKAVYIWERTA